MKKILYLIMALAVVSTSCKKSSDSTPTPTPAANSTGTGSGSITINSSDQFTVKVDGTTLAKVADGSTVDEVNSSFGGWNPPDSSKGEYSTSFSNQSTFQTYLEIGKGTLIYSGQPASTTSFKAFFNTGSYSYSAGPYLEPLNGVYIHMNIGGTDYTTYNGSQSGSAFTVTDLQEKTLNGNYYVKLRITFSCKIYDSGGNAKTLTEGIFVGYFADM